MKLKFTSEGLRDDLLAIALVIAGVTLRLLPHPQNFTPVAALALFSGFVFRPALALTLPLTIMIISDLWIGVHSLFLLTWGSFLAVSAMGTWLARRDGMHRILIGSLAGSVLFFIVTNLGVFFIDKMYPMSWAGFYECFLMALPFFRNSVAGDLFYVSVIFSVFALLKYSARNLLQAK